MVVSFASVCISPHGFRSQYLFRTENKIAKLPSRKFIRNCRKRQETCVKKIPLPIIGCENSCNQTFRQVKDSLCNEMKLSHKDPKKVICVHTDASDRFWYGFVKQFSKEELCKPLLQHTHDPLAFLDVLFTSTQEKWTT